MTREEIMNLNAEQVEERAAAIAEEMETDGADLDALKEEAEAIAERRAAIIEERKAAMHEVAAGSGEIIEERKDEKKMTNLEVRKSAEYVDAFANYIKTGDDRECRALLTEGVEGGVLPVPVILDEIVQTAWERDSIMSRVRRTYIRGNLKTAFELSATEAVEHVEGTAAPAEEVLALGIVTMIPRMIKKWIHLSDEAVAMGGEAFLRYIYDELTYQITRKEAALAIADVVAAPAESTETAVGVPSVALAPSITTIATAAAQLTDAAVNPVVVLNRQSEADFVAAYAAGNFAVDPFAGYTRIYTTALPAYSAAAANTTYAIVGDLDAVHFNFPEGEDVIIKWDDLSEAEADLVKVVGRIYAAHAVTGIGKLVKITKPGA